MKKLFVGNMSFNTTENDLRDRFEAFGELGSVQIITDHETGRARGFAFVEMIDDQQANEAMAAINGTMLDGRPLNVNEAKPKASKGFRNGGDYGRGGGRMEYSRQARR